MSSSAGTDIRREVALLADARDFQKAFREVWEMPYVALPTPERGPQRKVT